MNYDSGSDNNVEGEKKTDPGTPVCSDITRPAPNPFPERSAATAITALGAMSHMDSSIITNPLDEKQQRILEQAYSVRRKAELQATFQRHTR